MCYDVTIDAALRFQRVDVLGPLGGDVIDPRLPERGLPQRCFHEFHIQLRRRQIFILLFVMAFDLLFILETTQCLVIPNCSNVYY